MQFLTIFSGSMKTKSEVGFKKEPVLDDEEVGKNSLFETSQHLLFAHYLLSALSARESKTKLLYTLNAFRSVQKRITLDLRELGTRDRVMGDINSVKPMEKQQMTKFEEADEDTDGVGKGTVLGSQTQMSMGQPSKPALGSETTTAANAQDIDNVIQDEMVDINRFRYQN